MPPSPATTLTLYFCGSGNNLSNEKANKFVVPHLVKIARGRHMGYSGPGGNANGALVYRMNGNGTFYQDAQGNKQMLGHDKVVTAIDGVSGKEHGAKPTKVKKSGYASAFGGGANAVIEAALKYIANTVYKGDMHGGRTVDTINLVGHSRGATTAILVAWGIWGLFKRVRPNLRVNMFLFDPVAGNYNEYESTYTVNGEKLAVELGAVPPCVRSFRALIAANMSGKTAGVFAKDAQFQSSMPDVKNVDDVRVYVMPGGHNAACKYNLKAGGSSIGEIGLALAQDFLVARGSQFSSRYRMTPQMYVEWYCQSRLAEYNPDYAPHEGRSIDFAFYGKKGEGLVSPHRAKMVATYSKTFGEHPFFVNDHHREMFAEAYPSFVKDVDAAKKRRIDDSKLYMSGMTKRFEATYALLKQTGLVDEMA